MDTVSGDATGPSGVDVSGQLIRLADVPLHVPPSRSGKRVDRSVPFRWASRGLRGVKLEYIQIGGTRYTNSAALQRFFERLTALNSGQHKVRSTRQDAIDAADRLVRERISRSSEGK